MVPTVSKHRKSRRRRATWVAFCLVALAAAVTASSPKDTDATKVAVKTPDVNEGQIPLASPTNTQDYDAARVHSEALQTLTALSSSPTHPTDPYTRSSSQSSILTSFLGSLFPAPNQRGPIATALRIAQRLRQQSWVPKPIWLLVGKKGGAGRGKKGEEMRGRAVKVLDLLEHAIELGNVDALYTLGRISLFPPPALPLNATRAFLAFRSHAQLTGNATSLSMTAFLYSTGYRKLLGDGSKSDVEDMLVLPQIDQARALLYYTFAGEGGDYGSQMALGYRYWTGIGVNEDCMAALDWYEAAAEQAMAHFLSGAPGGRTLPLTHTKLSDLEGGVYGPGASVASTGPHGNRHVIKAANARAAGETWEDVLEYYQFNAERGEIEFAYRLGKIYYQGSVYPSLGGVGSGAEGVGAVTRDYYTARGYFLRIARQLWPHENQRKKADVDDQTTIFAAQSACYLGRMNLRGEGGRQDFKYAKLWFDRGAEYGDRECHNGLGIIWRDGLGVNKDEGKANENFLLAAGQDLAEAQVNLGKYHYYRGEIQPAITYFDAAMRHGSPFEAAYYIASIHASRAQNPASPAVISAGSCPIAVSFYKLVAERGCWKDDLLTEAEALWKAGEEKHKGKSGLIGSGVAGDGTREQEEAMLRWFIASERGYEIAQNNIAWVLDQDKSSMRHTRFATKPSNETARIALTQWTRSAGQRNVDALVKVGDYYFYGLGVNDESESLRWEKAAGFYHSAVDTQLSALAMWNLGWMYENGIGVTQDFYLAKRYYDMALETNAEAYFPIMLSLIKLHLRSLWYELWGGKGKGVSLWRDASDDDHWYLGKSKEDRERRLKKKQKQAELEGVEGTNEARQDSDVDREEEDPVQWARDRRNAEEGSGDFGPEDYFDGALRGGRRDAEEDDDEFLETMFLFGLCALVSVLIYLRGRWVAQRRREEQEALAQGGAAPPPYGGLFPPPDDPARQEWAILH